jgi:hypothetical protein
VLTQLIGLFCLLLALAALFYLWSQAVDDRSKHVESSLPPSEPAKEADSPRRAQGYSLAPMAPNDSLVSPIRAVETLGPSFSGPELSPSMNPVLGDHKPADDELAKTHLEIARQFFDMGDFEGATDMTRLVIDNKSASSQQKEVAELLHEECR